MEFRLVDPKLIKDEFELEDDWTLASTVLVQTKKGPALVMDEGVGWFFNEEGYDGQSTVLFYGPFGSRTREISLEQAQRCLSENTITLENLIGTYNDRYRANLSLWQGQVEGVEQNVLSV